MRRIVLLSWLLWAPGAFAQGEKAAIPRKPEVKSFLSEDKVAVVVGINDYPEESDLPLLQHAVDDAAGLAQALTAQGYTVDLIPQNRAMRSIITKHLRDAAGSAHGTLVFAFSGHGSAGKLKPDENFLAGMDIIGEDIDHTGISITEVEEILKTSPAPRKMMFLDACRDGAPPPGATTRSKGKAPDAMKNLSGSSGMRILYSTTPGKRSYEDDKLGHGIFTKFLIDGINGEAAGPDGLVTFRSLEDYVHLKVKEYKQNQEPFEGPSDGAIGDFYIAGQPKPEGGRKALVIGIDKYPDRALLSPVKDAHSVSEKLKSLGFEVTMLENPTKEQIADGAASFDKGLAPEDMALFYYAGSGGLCEGMPSMIPANVRGNEEAARSRGIISKSSATELKKCSDITPVTDLQAQIADAHKAPVILIFDMCLSSVRGDASDFKPGKLARDNFFYLFAAEPGQIAGEDEQGGLFTKQLVQAIGSSGVSTASLTGKIGLAMKKAGVDQYPSDLNYIAEPFYFEPSKP